MAWRGRILGVGWGRLAARAGCRGAAAGLALLLSCPVPGLGADTPQWRPALHFSPAAHWMNDPNGPILLDGVYHLFYQYNPGGMVWGPMSWGHATSPDLLHWHEQAIALRAKPGEDMFSGTVILDRDNRSGLGNVQHPALLAFYTSVFTDHPDHPDGTQAQSLAYSLDNGATWQAYAHNPILTLQPDSRQFRDPSLTWYAAGQCWIMATVVGDAQVIKLYRSTDLLHWSFLSDFQPSGYRKPGMAWEMPLLVPLPLDGNPQDMRWVMLVSVNPWSIAGGSGVQYFIGRFDGVHFTPDALPPVGADPSAYGWLDHGADHYATARIANTGTGPPTLIGWMNNWDYAQDVPTAPWRGQMTLPAELALKTLDGHPTLVQAPAQPYRDWLARQGMRTYPDRMVGRDRPWRAPFRGDVLDIRLTLRRGDGTRAGLVVRQTPDGKTGTVISYDFTTADLIVDRGHSGDVGFSPKFSPVHIAHLAAPGGVVSLHVVIDRCSVEVFANDGVLRMTDLVFPPADGTNVSLFSTAGSTRFSALRVTVLNR
ncbi:glycoside hydrolase family 32 protein [Acetobacter sp. TBRC 12305]|uniref:Glycoside hydrolase family 32 protein n=1 Tax=Acetobacter garciniae TaxID=2817435 RepID=A0A939KQA5_9PROT|nr:glycoside hydrolase family 32 protein [Acetobacter garciniae]MBO1325119.1 glycoside hydrolase family 32 protein [Acetobacter garciniae]MBX0344910.1 glycoside hydrolase family 32 protein [Acetobacter garciniae]